MPSVKNPNLLTVIEAVGYLQDEWGIHLEVSSLAAYRSRGLGPVFVKVGRSPRYLASDLDAYAQSLISPRKISASKLAAKAKPTQRKHPRPTAAMGAAA